ESGAADDLAAQYPDKAAAKFAGLAYTRLLQQKPELAITAAEKALAQSKTVKIRFMVGRVLAQAGREARARELATGLESETQDEPRAYAKLMQGEIALNRGDPRMAAEAFMGANNMLDTWIGHFDLGRAYLEEKAFPEADSEFGACIRRRGEALVL